MTVHAVPFTSKQEVMGSNPARVTCELINFISPPPDDYPPDDSPSDDSPSDDSPSDDSPSDDSLSDNSHPDNSQPWQFPPRQFPPGQFPLRRIPNPDNCPLVFTHSFYARTVFIGN